MGSRRRGCCFERAYSLVSHYIKWGKINFFPSFFMFMQCIPHPPSRATHKCIAHMNRVQDKSPTLDTRTTRHRYSRALKEMIDSCLAKDPAQRPSAAQLLQMPIFATGKNSGSDVRRKGYLVGAVLSTSFFFLEKSLGEVD